MQPGVEERGKVPPVLFIYCHDSAAYFKLSIPDIEKFLGSAILLLFLPLFHLLNPSGSINIGQIHSSITRWKNGLISHAFAGSSAISNNSLVWFSRIGQKIYLLVVLNGGVLG